MKLALRHSPPKGFLQKLFYLITRARLVTCYPHSGIVIGNVLYHTNLTNGLHSEPFNSTGWLLIDVPNSSDEFALQLFEQHKGKPYDWFSLLAFVLPWSVRDSSRMYCYEWSKYAITGLMPSERVTPEDLLVLVSNRNQGIYE